MNTTFTIEYVKDLAWNDVAKTSFSCTVKYQEFNEELPVGVDPADPYPHIQELWGNGNNGLYGPIAEFIEPVLPQIEEIPVVDFL